MRRSGPTEVLSFIAVLTLTAAPALAAAPQLKSISPGQGAAVSMPHDVILRFDRELATTDNQIDLFGPGGARVKTGPLSVNPSDRTSLSMPITEPVKPGGYHVEWHARSIDGDKADGTSDFTVR